MSANDPFAEQAESPGMEPQGSSDDVGQNAPLTGTSLRRRIREAEAARPAPEQAAAKGGIGALFKRLLRRR